MSGVFELEIISSNQAKKEQVHWIDVEGLTGDFIVGPGHDTITSILKPKGRMIYKTSQNLEVDMDIFGGVIYVENDRAIVILD